MKNVLTAVLLSTALVAPAASIAQSASTAQSASAAQVPDLKNVRLPPAEFGRQPFMRAPRISPDGTKIVVQLSSKGKGAIGWIDLTKPGSAPNFFVGTNEVRDVGDRSVDGYRWVGNDVIVVRLLSRENIFGERGDVTRLIAYNIATKKTVPLAWDGAVFSGAGILDVDHDKGTILLQRTTNSGGYEMYNNPEVVRVDVHTGKYTNVQRANAIVGGWEADDQGVVRLATGYNGNSDTSGKSRTLYRSNASQQFRTVMNEADTTFTGALPQAEHIVGGSDVAIGSSNKDNYRRLYKLDMSTMKVGELIFEKPGFDVEGVVTDFDGKKVIGYSYTDTQPRVQYIDKDWQIIQSVIDEQFGKGNARVVSSDRKAEKIVFFVAKSSQPGGYYLFNTVTGKLELLGWYHQTIKGGDVNPMRSITYTARDGLKIPAVVTYPRHRMGQKNLPVVVMPHGGPFGAQDVEEFGYFPWHQMLAEQGYVVIQPNYRGSGGYGKDFVLKGRAPEGYGGTMQDDLNDAVTYFSRDGTIDAKRACILGWSYGGYAAARGAQRDANVWRCAVAGAGVYDMPLMNRWDTENLSTFSAKFQATAKDPVSMSPARNTAGKWAPILIVTAMRDQRIPMEQAQTLVSRLKASGKVEGTDFRYIVQPQGTHNLPYEDVHIQFLEEAYKWIDRWNPAYIASDRDKPLPLATAGVAPAETRTATR